MFRFFFALFLLSGLSLQAHKQALSELVYTLRNPSTEAHHFRETLVKIGEVLALEIMDELDTELVQIKTLTGATATHRLISEKPILVTILRAGLPLNAGMHNVFPDAEVGFLAMSRDEETLQARTDYVALPHLKDRTVIITDTMLATGGSILDAIKLIETREPKKIIIVVAIASEPGVARLLKHNPALKIIAATVDPSLNDKGYIMPGLGDAGDRSFGLKNAN